MWLTTSAEVCVKNVISISKANQTDLFTNSTDLKTAFQKATPNTNIVLNGSLTFVKDRNQALSFRKKYNNDSVLDDLSQNEIISDDFSSSMDIINNVEHCYNTLCDKSTTFKSIFDLVISYVFSLASDKACGGTSSELVGVIWANPRKHWNESDTHELLIHELAHNLMYIDEAKNGHYDNDLMRNRDTWCKSTILNIDRPLDKVVHSIVVGSEIVLAREEIFGHEHKKHAHPPTEIIVKRIQESIDSVRNNPRAMKVLAHDRPKELLHIVEGRMAKISGVRLAV
ncbi:aKG-HExxH-type peptide beta-hydroxylase [Vibrio sp. Vb339]|uniref:aKG-HExxH-type peptide beta-hydroxylase n=1 Tax=Vibrio sp. Vb339 TaxID=1192013 RepID=UPI001551A645|nr:HEXXH motif-containing putative peptide modification protein [Vibrio sp. Vb339]